MPSPIAEVLFWIWAVPAVVFLLTSIRWNPRDSGSFMSWRGVRMSVLWPLGVGLVMYRRRALKGLDEAWSQLTLEERAELEAEYQEGVLRRDQLMRKLQRDFELPE